MKQYPTSSAGFDLVFNGPSTAEEYDAKAGRVGAAVEDASTNTIYRSTLPKWQKAFVAALVALTSVERLVDSAATEKAKARAKAGVEVSDVLEKNTTYINRATAQYAGDDKDKLAELAKLAQDVANDIEVDPSATVRTPGVDKGSLAKAEDILSRDEDSMETTVSKLLAGVPDYVLERNDDDNKPEKNSLARLVSKFVAASI